VGLRRKGARRCHEAADRDPALAKILHDLIEIVIAAEDGNPAHGLPDIVRAVGENTLGMDLFDRASLDGSQHHVDVAPPPRRRVGMVASRSIVWRDRAYLR
jgi:hypothetical protein